MNAPYRIFGVELSPYSVKVRSYLRFKGLTHEWIERNAAREEEYRRYARIPLLPVIVSADEQAMQDSTPIIEALERKHPEPTIIPPDPGLAFLSALLEDFADEWLNKAMFHYRWTNQADREAAARKIADLLLEGQPDADRAPVEEQIAQRMVERLGLVGSSKENAAVIEGSYRRTIIALDRHLEMHPFVLGGRPSLADFGLAAQLQQLKADPSPGAILKREAAFVSAWCDFMQSPRSSGAFDGFDAIAPTLTTLLRDEIAGAYLPWMAANAQALQSGQARVRIEIHGKPYEQDVQRYAGKAYQDIKAKRAALGESPALDVLLRETGCEAYLR